MSKALPSWTTEEIETVIDFHESMARDAVESCEHEEAKWRRERAAELRAFLKRVEAHPMILKLR